MRNDKSRLRRLGERILELHLMGLSYRQIEEELGCSKSTISYHLGEGQKKKAYLRMKKSKLNRKKKSKKEDLSLVAKSYKNGIDENIFI